MSSSPYRVIQWGTGQTGTASLQAIIDHPDLELVGLRVYSEKKAGSDAGELAGRPATGVVATRDVDAILAMDADCVCYSATDMHGTDVVFDDLCAILRSGKNLVGVTVTGLVLPDLYPEVKARLEEASREGGSTFLWGGINPGFILDQIPAVLATGSLNVESVEVTEYLDLSTYEDPVWINGAGFGLTPEEDAKDAEFRTGMFETMFGPSPKLIAHAFGVVIDEIRPTRTIEVTDEAFDLPSSGCHVAKGTLSGIHFKADYLVGGTTRLTLNEYFRVAPGPDDPWPSGWPAPPGGNGGYRVTVNGQPTTQIDMSFPAVGANPLTDALAFTGIRVGNLIPAVCEAAPGVYGALDLGKGLVGRVHW